jgi:hypothetical protein
MAQAAASTIKLTKFYGELSPSLDTVKVALAVAGVDPEHPRASDLLPTRHRLSQPRHAIS